MDLTLTKEQLVARNSQIILATNNFWHYCRVIDPEYYLTTRPHLKKLAQTFHRFYKGQLLKPNKQPFKKLIVNMPPQFGKTRTLVHWCDWVLGQNQSERIITTSYNDDTASDFSRYVRDGITKEKFDPVDIIFRDIFPKARMKRGYSGHEKWALAGQHFNYLGAGVGGSITSKGATILIVDDPIKGAIEAYNDRHLEKLWLWYTGTFLSRVSAEGGEPLEVIVMTRWSKNDFCGKLLGDSFYKNDWYVLSMEARNKKTKKMLCPGFLGKDRYEYLRKKMDHPIFLANYHQAPVHATDTLYSKINTYDNLPQDDDGNLLFEAIYSYTDTADTGADFLCCIIFGVYLGRAYVLDVYYTDEPMEVTEPETARRLSEYPIKQAKIESNSGGRGFARNVARIHLQKYKRRLLHKWFHQSKNKEARIFAESAFVTEHVLMPQDWQYRWPEFYEAVMTYTRKGKNPHDDGPDALTGVSEMINESPKAKAVRL